MTQVYGSSDDLIEFAGGCSGEVLYYGTDDKDQGILIITSDGTLAEVKYGKNGDAIWGINVIKKGSLFDRLEICDDADAERYSDTLFLKEGITWAYACKGEWEKVE